MGNIFNADFREFIQSLNNSNVQYILVGGYSVILHGYSRTTGDMDIWVKKDEENYNKLVMAFQEFKMPLFDMTKENFMNNMSIDVFTFGQAPVSIDLMTNVKGLTFNDSYANSQIYELEDLNIRVINYDDLIKAKQASGRPRDLDDIEKLKKR